LIYQKLFSKFFIMFVRNVLLTEIENSSRRSELLGTLSAYPLQCRKRLHFARFPDSTYYRFPLTAVCDSSWQQDIVTYRKYIAIHTYLYEQLELIIEIDNAQN